MGMSGLSIGRTALQAHQRALEVTSQNLANANTEGYTRKVVGFSSRAPLNLPDVQGAVYSSQIGMGVEVSRIESVRDLLLNARIRDLGSDFQESDKTREILDQIESLFIGEIDLAQSFDDFFASLHDLSGAPDSLTVRSVVRARGVEMTDRIRIAAESIEGLRADIADEIENLPARINTITAELAQLNEQVAAMVTNGMGPNDFEDKRQVKLQELAEIGDVTVIKGEAEVLTILLSGQVVVQGTQSFNVQTIDQGPDRLPILAVGNSPDDRLTPRSGLLSAYASLQEETLTRLRDDLNELAITLTNSFNTIHETGFGLDGSTNTDFFTVGNPPVTETRVFSVKGATYVPEPTTPLDGIATTLQPENFETNRIGVGAFTINGRSIAYDGAIDSLQNVVDRINASGANVTAAITPENRLQLSARRQADYTISNLADSGNFLTRMGILPSGVSYPPASGTNPTSVFAGEATLRPQDDAARRITLTASIRNDLNRIAAARGEDLSDPPDGVGERSRGPGDGANALLLARLQDAPTMSGTGTFNQFIVGMLGELGVEAGAAKRTAIGLEAQMAQLEDRRQEIQGVSIDEELINMIKYQRGFEAASRIINLMDEVLQTLLALGR